MDRIWRGGDRPEVERCGCGKTAVVGEEERGGCSVGRGLAAPNGRGLMDESPIDRSCRASRRMSLWSRTALISVIVGPGHAQLGYHFNDMPWHSSNSGSNG